MRIILLFLFVFSVAVVAGVNRQSKSSVSFMGIGKFSSTEHVQLKGDKKNTDSESAFDSDDMIKGMAAKLILSPGNNGEIIDLTKMQIIRLDHKDQKYSVENIKKLGSDSGNMEQDDESQDESMYQDEKEQTETVRIIRSEFKVTETSKKKNINSFMCQMFTVLWLTEWEDLENGNRGTDSLFSVVWTTPVTSVITKAQQEESEFSQAYLSAIGIDVDATKNMILGSNWISILSNMSEGAGNNRNEGPDMANEMSKITGYPIMVDGKYYALRSASEKQAEEEDKGKKGGLFGSLTKKVLKKVKPKKAKTLGPALAWYTEVMSLAIENIPETVFQIPVGYKAK